MPSLRKSFADAQEALESAEKEVSELEASIVELQAQKEKVVAAETLDAHATEKCPEDFVSALGRLSVVLEALPAAYQSGNMDTAYDSVMENLRALSAMAPTNALHEASCNKSKLHAARSHQLR